MIFSGSRPGPTRNAIRMPEADRQRHGARPTGPRMKCHGATVTASAYWNGFLRRAYAYWHGFWLALAYVFWHGLGQYDAYCNVARV